MMITDQEDELKSPAEAKAVELEVDEVVVEDEAKKNQHHQQKI